MAQTYSTTEVAKHKDKDAGIWIIIENDVYDVSRKSLFSAASDLFCPHCASRQLRSSLVVVVAGPGCAVLLAGLARVNWLAG